MLLMIETAVWQLRSRVREPGSVLLDWLSSGQPGLPGETRGFLHAGLFRCGWRASYWLVEVYRLACIGIDQADRL